MTLINEFKLYRQLKRFWSHYFANLNKAKIQPTNVISQTGKQSY